MQLSDKIKLTRAILNIITYLFTCPELATIDKIQFRILKINKMSNKTFKHLGAKLTSSNETGNHYSLSRDSVEQYLNRLKNKKTT